MLSLADGSWQFLRVSAALCISHGVRQCFPPIVLEWNCLSIYDIKSF